MMNEKSANPNALIKRAISQYLRLFDRESNNKLEDLRVLALTLDNLVAVYYQTDDVDPDGDAEAPSKGYAGYYQKAAKAFPGLGLYPYAYPGDDPGESAPMVADAIDDLGDIAGDLTEVLWYFENATAEEAVWDFRFGYQHHWGDHLHSLRNYLHSSRIAAW